MLTLSMKCTFWYSSQCVPYSPVLLRVSSVLPGSQLSNVPWRRQGVKYANNEAYFDCVEDVDVIIDANGNVVSAEIHGNVRANK